MLIEIYGVSRSELLESKIWIPLGMAHTATWNTGLYGTELGFMALNSTPRDFSLLGQMLSQIGTISGNQIVNAAWIEDLRAP